MSFTLQQLQEEQREWAQANFPNATRIEPILGIIEEMGELAHATLKGIQGIRHTPEEILAMKKDAAADIMVYISHYCNLHNIELKVGLVANIDFIRTDVGSPAKILVSMAGCVGELADEHLVGNYKPAAGRLVRLIISTLTKFCELEGFDLMTELEYTWSKVKQRDWTKNPMNANKLVPGSM